MFTKDECSSKCLEGEEDDFLLYYAINSFVMRLNWRNFSSCSRVTCKTSIHDLYPPSPSSSPLFLMKHVAALYYKVLLAKKLNSKLCLSWKYYVLKGPSILRKKCGCNAHKKTCLKPSKKCIEIEIASAAASKWWNHRKFIFCLDF